MLCTPSGLFLFVCRESQIVYTELSSIPKISVLTSWGHNFSTDHTIQAHSVYRTPRTSLSFVPMWFIIFNPLVSSNITSWSCRRTVFCEHLRDQLANDEFSTHLNKIDAIRKVIKFTRTCFSGFSKSVQVPLRSTKKSCSTSKTQYCIFRSLFFNFAF